MSVRGCLRGPSLMSQDVVLSLEGGVLSSEELWRGCGLILFFALRESFEASDLIVMEVLTPFGLKDSDCTS